MVEAKASMHIFGGCSIWRTSVLVLLEARAVPSVDTLEKAERQAEAALQKHVV